MKIPKTIKTYCKFCKTHTAHRVTQTKTGQKRGALKHGSIKRAKGRGLGRGAGNKGRWGSKPSKPKRIGAKVSKKINLNLKCSICNKSQIRVGRRAKRIEIK